MSEEAKLLRELAGIARQSELHDLRVGFTPDEAERIAAHIERIERERCTCDEEKGIHDPMCVLAVRETARAMQARIADVERERDEARTILAHTDIGSLPNDWTLKQVAEARIDDMMKLRDQVRDTCARAEKAEAENARLCTLRDDVCAALSRPGGLRFEEMPERARGLRVNAERYEWLKAHAEDYDGHVTFPDVRYRNGLQDGFEARTVDEAIDAARKP